MTDEWELLSKEKSSDGYLKIFNCTLKHTRFQGGWMAPFDREVLERGHAVVVVPYDHALDSTLFVEQFRIGAAAAGESPWMTEFVAGIIDSGESEQAVARREAMEEAGCELKRLHPMGRYFVSPGCMTETLSLYLAEADLSNAGGVFGLDEEHENTRASVVSLDEAFERLEQGSINNAMTLIGLQWLKIHYQTLRATPEVYFN